MAFLIPENIRTSPSLPASHKNLATALAVGLSSAATVWYEPPFDIDGDRPHFVILEPSFGVIILMVLDGDVLGAAQGSIRVNAGGETNAANPLDQAITFGTRVIDAIGEHPELQRVTVNGVGVFPTLVRAEAEARGLDTLVDFNQCLFKDDLQAAKTDEDLLPRFFMRVQEGGVGDDLTDDEQRLLRGILHPDVVLAPAPVQGSLFTANELDTDIKVLDRDQERMARKLGSGHRVIRGVAGSGKTLLLVHRAKELARLLPKERILVTCYTRSLRSSLHQLLDEYDNIEVLTNSQLMSRAIKFAGLELPKKGKGVDWDATPPIALQAVSLKREPERYRAVLIDEAQDLSTEALKFLTTLFESDDPEQQDLLVVADNAQRIFDKSFTWKSAGISAQGRTNVMRRNYRNTYEIIDFAHKFLIADPNIEVDADDADGTAIIPVETTERHGKPVDVRFIDDQRQMVAAIIQQVTEWKPVECEPRSIAVLMQSQTRDGLGETLAREFDRYGINAFWVGDPDQPKNKDNVGMTDSPVVLSTIHSAKGLEFPNVIVTGITGDSTDPERMVRDRKTLYVGFTRAVNELVVLPGRDNAYSMKVQKRLTKQINV